MNGKKTGEIDGVTPKVLLKPKTSSVAITQATMTKTRADYAPTSNSTSSTTTWYDRTFKTFLSKLEKDYKRPMDFTIYQKLEQRHCISINY